MLEYYFKMWRNRVKVFKEYDEWCKENVEYLEK